MVKKINMLNQYQKDINFLESLSNVPKQNYLLGQGDRSVYILRLRKFLSLIGNPEKKLKFIHITGTSGKGTTVKILESLMTDAGLKVGSYTSPFATTSIEKISIDNKLISPPELHRILENKIKPALDKYLLKFTNDPISYFEAWLAIALLYFENKKCDWVILEAGLGGEHDATNVIANPKITAITNVGLDHTDILGDTREKIAKDKAGIIKKNSLFLSTEKKPKLLKIFKNACRKKSAWFIKPNNLIKNYRIKGYFSTKRQLDNLNLALNILEVIKVAPKNPETVINNFQLICRQEIVQNNPLIILDGAHNKDKLSNLLNFVGQQKYKKLHLIVGFAFNKKNDAPLKKLLKISDRVYLTRFLNAARKSADLRRLYKIGKKTRPRLAINIYNDPHQALTNALKLAKKDDLILVAGSFFLTGELRKKWISEEYILKHLKLDKR